MRRRTFIRGAVAWFLSGPSAWAVDRPEPFLRLRHANARAVLSFRFERRGLLDPAVARRLNWFVRDWRAGRSMPVDPTPFRFLACIRHFAFGESHEVEIHLLSGFRTCKANDMLRRAGLGAARNLLHLEVKAAEISIAGLSRSRIAAYLAGPSSVKETSGPCRSGSCCRR